MITTTVTVSRITPLYFAVSTKYKQVVKEKAYLNAAAAPKRAYVPGVMHGTSGWHTENIPEVGYAL